MMKYLRLLLLSALFFFGAIFMLTVFMPSAIVVSRAVNLPRGKDSVLNFVNDLNHWQNWYPGFNKNQVSPSVYTNGRLTSATVNKINLRITQANDSLVIVQMLKGRKPVYQHWRLIRYPSGDSVTLQTQMNFNLSWYPWEKLSGLLFEKSYGPVMEQGLANLKHYNAGR